MSEETKDVTPEKTNCGRSCATRKAQPECGEFRDLLHEQRTWAQALVMRAVEKGDVNSEAMLTHGLALIGQTVDAELRFLQFLLDRGLSLS